MLARGINKVWRDTERKEMRSPAEVGEVRECFRKKADIEDKPLKEEEDREC